MATIRVIAGRHANAEGVQHPENDLGRILSTKGLIQARKRAATLDTLVFSRVLSSPAVRAVQTAAFVTDRRYDSVERIPQLYTPEGADGLLLDKMFHRLGHKPIRAYIGHEMDDGCVMRFSQNAGAAIDDILAESDEDETMAMFGHGVFMPLAFLSLIPENQTELRDKLLDLNLGEAEVFEVIITDGIVTEVNLLD